MSLVEQMRFLSLETNLDRVPGGRQCLRIPRAAAAVVDSPECEHLLKRPLDPRVALQGFLDRHIDKGNISDHVEMTQYVNLW